MTLAPIHIQKYEGRSQEESLRLFAEDSVKAREMGYRPADQTWEGTALLVTYQFVGVAMARNPALLDAPPVAQSASPWDRPGAAKQLVLVVIIAVVFMLVITVIDVGMTGGTFSHTPAAPTLRR